MPKQNLVDVLYSKIEDFEQKSLIDAIVKENISGLKEELSGVEGLKENAKEAIKNEYGYKVFKDLFNSYGFNDVMDLTNKSDENRVPLKDLLTSPQFSIFFPKYVTELAMEAAEPQMILTSLLEVVPFKGLGYTYPVFDSMGGDFDMAEGDEPRALEFKAGGWKDVKIGKSGLRLPITEEAIRYSDYNIMKLFIRAGAIALARWKETKAAQMMIKAGTANACLDGDGGGGLGRTSGVDVTGSANYGLTFIDIIKAMVHLIDKGFMPDTIIMNPMAYPVFMLNDTMRSFFFASAGARSQMVNWPGYEKWMPNLPASQKGHRPNPFGYNIENVELPGGLLGKPMKIVLSPFIPYNGNTHKTDILIGDSTVLGQYILDQLPTTEQFKDPLRDIHNIKMIERYAMAPHYAGSTITAIKNVAVVECFDPRPFYSINPEA